MELKKVVGTPKFGKIFYKKPRKAFFLIWLLLFILIGFLFGRPALKLSNQITEKENLKNQQLNQETSRPTQNIIFEENFKVTKVIDGDTFEIEGNKKIRLIGINAPEMGQPYSLLAKEKLEELILNKNVRLKKDVSEKDKYGRLLRYVFQDKIFVNLELIKQGYAQIYTLPPDIKYQEKFYQAQKYAQTNKLGLWSGKQIQECLIKGNISSSGEKIYHLPGQRYYDKTVIDESKGERWFCTEQEAIQAGWRKSKY